MFEKFRDTWLGNKNHRDDLVLIMGWIKRMGEREGALERYFRHEGKAHALPPPATYTERETGDLRLYCMVVNPNLIFLFSGAAKTTIKAQDCPYVSGHFRDATMFSSLLEQAIKQKELKPSNSFINHHLIIEEGFELIYT